MRRLEIKGLMTSTGKPWLWVMRKAGRHRLIKRPETQRVHSNSRILTNGHHWRIYHKETSYKLDSYYEIDLVNILNNNDIEGFRYFYLFFRLRAFVKDASGRGFLDRVRDESTAYSAKLRENLQQNVYKAMKILSEGFFEWKDNALVRNERDLREVQENTLKLLYRLLFIFYAESLKLLDRDNPE